MSSNGYNHRRDYAELDMEPHQVNGQHRLETGHHSTKRRSSRSRSRSPRPMHDGWQNPAGSLKTSEEERGNRDSEGRSSDPPSRRQSDDAYEKIREASYKKDPRRASEPANKQYYPPPPKLETYPTQPRSFLWLAMLTAIVNIVFGIAALVCAITSDNAWAAGNRAEAKRRGRFALAACIAGIACTAIIIIAVPVSYKYLVPT